MTDKEIIDENINKQGMYVYTTQKIIEPSCHRNCSKNCSKTQSKIFSDIKPKCFIDISTAFSVNV